MPPRVLVVEDNLVNLELVTAVLEEVGCHVLAVTSAEGVVHLAAAERPDLILMDLQLPGMTGYEATCRLKADPTTASIPVVALTAQAMRGDEARAIAAGCDAYLAKPLDPRIFWNVLRRVLPRGDLPSK